jgi:predicted nucleotidyltransferase
MSKLKKILSSFKTRETLNPKIWVKEDSKVKMRPKVREKLLEIANDFIESLKVDIIVTDVIMTGSLANFNWSNFSDVDLHIVANFSQFPEEQLPLYEELFALKKTIYNDKHNLMIFGYDVELYVQNEVESHFSSGVYSVLFDEWANKPKKEDIEVDTKLIEAKSKQWMEIIDGVIENAKDESVENAKKLIKKYKDKIKKYRTCGLEKEGEYSDENLVFKVLRRNGYIEKLYNFENEHIDKNYSLKESETNIGGTFKTDLENGPANHGKRAFGNWQSDNAWDIFSPPGTVVNSYTNGVVTNIRNTGKRSGKVFGTQVSIKGGKGFPDIFYTHLKNVKLSKGDTVNLGDYIGEISEWCRKEDCVEKHSGTHVHIGLPRGRHLRELLVNSDKIFSGSKNTSDDSPTENQTSNDVDSDKFILDLKNLLSLSKPLINQKKFVDRIEYDKNVETLQTALQLLGFSLPRWGVDGKFGNETEKAVMEFQSKSGLDETGEVDTNVVKKIIQSLLELGDKTPELLKKIQKTKTETIPDSEVDNKSSKDIRVTSDNEYSIIKSPNYSGKNVHVLFGGSHTSGYSRGSANPSAIKKYVPLLEPYANNVIIVVTHHMNSLDNVRKYVKEKFNGVVTSIAGFSQGGREAWEHADDSSLKLVGLIDPSTYKTGLPLGSNTYLYCDPKNWDTVGFKGQTRKRLEWYCNNKDKYGDHVICFKQGGTHMNFKILNSFYSKFGDRL